MNKLIILISCLLFAAHPLCIAEDAMEVNDNDSNGELDTALIEGRDPFWPVGYTPPPPEPEPDPEAEITDDAEPIPDDDPPPQLIEKEETEWPRLRVRGITSTLDGGYIAMVDGLGIVEKDQIIQMTERNIIFRWEVVDITKRGLNTRRIDARPVE